MRSRRRGLSTRDETGARRTRPGGGFTDASTNRTESAGNQFRCQFRRPLLARNDAHIGFLAESLFRPCSKLRAYAVVAAQSVAAGKDETTCRVRHFFRSPNRIRSLVSWKSSRTILVDCAGNQSRATRSTTSPSAESSEITSGICPKACVEQLRHGSKVRTTASTRFRTPSVNLPSFT